MKAMSGKPGAWAVVCLWMAAIFALSSIPGKDIPSIGIANLDKLVHFFLYLVLGVLTLRAFDKTARRFDLKKFALISILIGTLYGVSDECHQYNVQGRKTDILDLAADAIGVAVGVYEYSRRR